MGLLEGLRVLGWGRKLGNNIYVISEEIFKISNMLWKMLILDFFIFLSFYSLFYLLGYF